MTGTHHPFSVGQTVKCVQAALGLTIGAHYVVTRILWSHGAAYVEVGTGTEYLAARFQDATVQSTATTASPIFASSGQYVGQINAGQIAQPPPPSVPSLKAGDEVVVVNGYGQRLVNGNRHTVTETRIDSFGELKIRVTGDGAWWNAERFTLADGAAATTDLLGEALRRGVQEPVKKAYEPETFVGKPIDWLGIIKETSRS